ncbi:isoaspartyl peptidase/L-asparaginase family protein [Mesorhizobium sp. M1066]|uniref:isoaspartyl peptidase/L-asparaginase family protein n=2 Tax=unclassified Mesorhizobium TaxID=325217 RepID=UPI00333866D4
MWSLIVHGGAKDINPEEEEANRRGCINALEAGRTILASGGTAVDAVEAAVRVLESDPTFNAGYGSALNRDGEIEMCASLMEGKNVNIGAVTVIAGVRHPISVAKAMLFEEPILLASDGARRFAEQKQMELCDPADLVSPEQRELSRTGKHDTVGCIALDQHGSLAVGTSTGGLAGIHPGRVGDSPLPGCGYYADNHLGAVAFSGDGEHIARKTLAARVMHALADGPEQALETSIKELETIGGEAGGIVLTAAGLSGWAHNSREFAVAFMTSDDKNAHVFLRKEDKEIEH